MGGTLLGVPIIRIIIFLGIYWGPHILGNCHIRTIIGIINGDIRSGSLNYSSHTFSRCARGTLALCRGSMRTAYEIP